MTKQVNKKIAALAMAAVMGVGGLGMAKLFQSATTASADTGTHSSYALNASAGTIGINQHATVEVTSKAPATLTLNDVAAGQYMIVAKVVDATGEYYWIDLSATVNGNTVYLGENEYLNAYIGNVTVASDSTITLSTYSDANLTVEVWLQQLAIGQFNDYYLDDISISSTTSRDIVLDNVSGTYFVIVETYDSMAPDAVIKVNGTTLTKNPDMNNAWVAELTLTGVEKLTLSTTSEEAITVNLTLRAYVYVDEVLPMDDYAEFSIYESQNFFYRAESDGYFSLSYTSDVENAEFSFMVKTDPNNYDGITVLGENFPVYMEEGVRYYITVTYTGIPWELGESPATAKAKFAVEKWTKPTLELNKEAVYVPVTTEDDKVEIPLNIEEGTYDLSLMNIPFDILFGGYTVTAHFGTQSVELDYGNAQITITDETSIWFTTDYSTGFAAGVAINAAQVIETIKLGEWNDISVSAGESRMYYLENIEEGYFNITLQNLGDAAIVVESSTFSYPVISEGQTFGTFFVATYGEATATISIYFYNNSLETANFQALVQPTGNVTMELGVAQGIELASGQTKVYYLENLNEGLYDIALANAAGIDVAVNGMAITDGKFTTNFDGESVAIRFTNTGDETVIFTATVTMIANGVITVGEEQYIVMDADRNVKEYMVEGLEEGKEYTIKLADYVTGVTVKLGDVTVIEAGATTGTFTVTADTIATLTFTYSGADYLYFSVIITANTTVAE